MICLGMPRSASLFTARAHKKSVTLGTGRPKTLPRPGADAFPLSCTWHAHGLSTALRREPVASTSSLRAALLLVGAAPVFLVIAPPSLPVGISCVTIVRLGCGLRATHLLVRAAPLLLVRGPASFPIRVPGVCVRLGAHGELLQRLRRTAGRPQSGRRWPPPGSSSRCSPFVYTSPKLAVALRLLKFFLNSIWNNSGAHSKIAPEAGHLHQQRQSSIDQRSGPPASQRAPGEPRQRTMRRSGEAHRVPRILACAAPVGIRTRDDARVLRSCGGEAAPNSAAPERVPQGRTGSLQ